jgi:lambda family phage tail tape measure protein
MTNQVARLGVTLGINSAEFSQGLSEAGRKLREFAEKAEIMGKAGAVGFAAMTYKALEFADQISDVAKANDVAIATVLKLGEALQQNGGNAENAGKLLSGFTNFVDNAATGSFQAQKSFEKAGISLKDLGKLSTEELFNKTVKGLAAIEDPLTRNAKAFEIFGRASRGVDWVGMAKDMAHTSHLTLQQADAIKDAGDAWDMLHAKSHDAMVAFAVGVGPSVKAVIEYYDELMGKTELFGETVKHIAQTLGVLVADTLYVLTGMGREIAHTYENAKLVMTGAFEEARRQNEKFEQENERRAIRMAEVQNKILGVGFDAGSGTGWDAEKQKGGLGRNVKKGVDPEAQRAEALRLQKLAFMLAERRREGEAIAKVEKAENALYTAEVNRQELAKKTLKDEQDLFELNRLGRYMRAEDLQLSKDLMEIEAKRVQNVRELELKYIGNQDVMNTLVARERDLADQAERFARARNEAIKADREGSFGKGFQTAMDEYFRNASTYMEQGQQAFNSVMGNMTAALDNFARTGKISFKSLAQSIIQDLIAIQLKAQALSMFKSMGLGNLFGMGGGQTMSTSSFEFGIENSGMYADGGDPPVGKASIVGERGPELFVPKTAGTIIPNNMLGSAMGGGGQSITYNGPYIANMSAIDTQSATQFLSKNKSAVWAANQTAQRSLPQSR